MTRRDNGLPGSNWREVVEVEPPLADALLAALADEGIAAYAVPSTGSGGGMNLLSAPHPGAKDHVYVVGSELERAEHLVEQMLAALSRPHLEPPEPATPAQASSEAEPEAAPHVEDSASPQGGALSDDDVWAGIVAAYAAPPAEPAARAGGSRPTPPDADDRESAAPRDARGSTEVDDALGTDALGTDALGTDALKPDAARPDAARPDALSTPPGTPPVSDTPRTRSGATGFEEIRAELDERRRARPAPIEPEVDPTEHYIPPPPPPIPRGTLITQAGWAGVLGGPLFLILATLFGWDPGGTTGLLAVFAFVGGFITLAVHRGDDPPDEGDDGAVV